MATGHLLPSPLPTVLAATLRHRLVERFLAAFHQLGEDGLCAIIAAGCVDPSFFQLAGSTEDLLAPIGAERAGEQLTLMGGSLSLVLVDRTGVDATGELGTETGTLALADTGPSHRHLIL